MESGRNAGPNRKDDVVPVIAASYAEARATLRAQMAETCRSDLNNAFEVWLSREAEPSADFASITEQAAKKEGADQDFQTAALLGFAADADLLSELQVGALKRSLHRLAGRNPVVNGRPMAFCSDAVGILGVVLGTRALADTDVTAQIVRWARKFLKASYERDGVEDWHRCLLAVAGRYLGKPLDLEIPASTAAADVRTALLSRGLVDVGDRDRAQEDAAETLKVAVQEPPTNLSHDRTALRLAALEWVIRASRWPAGQRDQIKGSMDLASQTDPIWTVMSTQKGPIPVTVLSGKIARRPTDASNGIDGESGKSEHPGALEAQAPKESRKAKKPVRRNQRYKVIDRALQEIAATRPSTQVEVFQLLDGRHIVFPPAEPFMAARGWLAGFHRDPAAARAWLSKRWAELNLPPLPRGPKNPKK
jgi:hypothetical protein